MKKMLGLAAYGLLLFGVSAGVGVFLNSRSAPETPEGAEDLTNPINGSYEDPDVRTAKTADAGLSDPAEEIGPLPVAVRPNPMSVEEIVRYGMGLKARDEAIQSREESLKRIEARQKLVLADITAEQKEVEGLLTQARDQRTAADELLRRVAVQKQSVEADRQKLESDSRTQDSNNGQSEADRQANLREVTEIVQGMAPEKAAATLIGLANAGKTELVVDFMAGIEQRRASAILDNFTDDEPLLNTILQGLVERRRPQKTTSRR